MHNNRKHIILLGGIGGDSHSVGLTILRHALSSNGYRVNYLGVQNKLEDFIQLAGFCNVVMISSMDGHARHYLREFPQLIRHYQTYSPLWYLGGNLHIGEGNGYERHFLTMGFDRVFVKFIDVKTILKTLEQDLQNREPVVDCSALWERLHSSTFSLPAIVSDQRIEREEIERIRPEVLAHWKTGYQAMDIVENARFLKNQPSFVRIQAMVKSGHCPILIQPRSGVPLIPHQIKLFEAFKRLGIQVLSYQVDSLTRNNDYVGAEEQIRESQAIGKATINGFPVINHGVSGLRRIINQVKVPLQTRHSTRDPRLLAEISYAGGVTSFEGGAICYNIPYYKDYSLDDSIRAWQYVDRLTGLFYERFGILLDREFFGTLTATLIPPSLAIAVNVIEAILAVRQGVKSVSLGYAEQGHRIQDIAAIRTLAALGSEILQNLGFKDVQVNTVFHQYMAAFPEDRQRAAEIIYHSALTAALSSATRIINKTPAEAQRLPTLDDNAEGIKLVSRAILEATYSPLDQERITEECAIIRQEVEALLDSVIYCGDGDIAKGVVIGFRKGFIDIPFSPSIHNRGEVMTARDAEGAIRFLSFGNLQFNHRLREYHREKMAERRRAEGMLLENQSYLLVEQDVLQIARGQYERWPLFT
jgi:methylaspartate mutase epsilon subunit